MPQYHVVAYSTQVPNVDTHRAFNWPFHLGHCMSRLCTVVPCLVEHRGQ